MFVIRLALFLSFVLGCVASNTNQQHDGFFITAEGIRVATCTKAAASLINKWCDQGAFLLSDFDGVIGAGTGHADGTPSRFVNGKWQPRCSDLLDAFCRQYDLGNALFLSSGVCFLEEKANFGLPKTNFANAEILAEGLKFFLGSGFYTHQPAGVQSQKGAHFHSIAQHVKKIYNEESLVFVDDDWLHIKSVYDACQSRNINVQCIWLPHREIYPQYWSNHHSQSAFQ